MPAPTQGCGVTQHSLSRSPVIIFTHPLLTALAWHSYTSGLVAPETWRACTEAQRRASHRTTDACAVVPAAGLERLPVAVTHSIQDAAHADHLCKHRQYPSFGQAAEKGNTQDRDPGSLLPGASSAQSLVLTHMCLPKGGQTSEQARMPCVAFSQSLVT